MGTQRNYFFLFLPLIETVHKFDLVFNYAEHII